MEPEAERLIEEFRMGRMPMLQFMRSMNEVKESGGCPGPDPLLGKAVVAGRARHTEGRDLMSIILEALGFEVIAAKRDTSIEDLVRMCEDEGVTALCLSIQTTYDIPDIRLADELMRESGIRDRIVFNAGGVAVSEKVAMDCGCDVYGSTAVDSAESIRDLVRSRSS
ncbi:MAG: hypothetical protein E7Z64_06875 [Thermoplasmata archaeon]|nr:hypothetical protein [Thermoplasmata archaeon]